MADCILCGGPNNYTSHADPVEAFKSFIQSEDKWEPNNINCQTSCCAVVCADCCNSIGGDGAIRCARCRQRLHVWVSINVIGKQEGINESDREG